MIEGEVAKRFLRARAEGRSFMLVCIDTWDRLRGDEDLGYHYPTFDDAEAVRDYIARHQFGEWDPADGRDFCETVIDLKAAGETFSRDACQAPAAWLAGSFRNRRRR